VDLAPVSLLIVSDLTDVGVAEVVPTFDELHEAHYRPVLRLAVLLVGDHATGEDLVADAYAKVFVRWRRVA
jgi:DNA-directed RNA polymerase specialized sigma24 family protein